MTTLVHAEETLVNWEYWIAEEPWVAAPAFLGGALAGHLLAPNFPLHLTAWAGGFVGMVIAYKVWEEKGNTPHGL